MVTAVPAATPLGAILLGMVLTGATGARLVLDGHRVSGIGYLAGGEVRRATAREAILSAGSVGSPHNLQVSPTGPAELLQAEGV